MSKAAQMTLKRKQAKKGDRDSAPRPKKRIRKQKNYHSSSEDSETEEGFAPVNLLDSEDESVARPVKQPNKKTKSITLRKAKQVYNPTNDSDAEEGPNDEKENKDDEGSTDGEDASEAETTDITKRKAPSKRNDPEAFSNSISKILSTKLSQTARQDPVLSRSRDAAEASTSLANERLERKVKAKIRAEKKEALDRGRVKDALGVETGDAGEVKMEEQRLRKIAQRGVTRMFNAVRAAQVKAEQAAREERKKGTVGTANREEKINELSKQGFLELISGKKAKTVEET